MGVLERIPDWLKWVIGAIAVFWVNCYIIRDVFFLNDSGHMNSMQGFWMAMARLADTQWFRPGWWPYFDGGAPFEFVYAPLTPGLVAMWSHLASVSPSRAWFGVTALYYILGPLTLYMLALWLTRSAVASTAVAMCYTLISPSSLLIPDDKFGVRNLLLDRRTDLMGVWDETPHMAALIILPILWIFLTRAVLHRFRRDIVISVLLMSLEAAASAFGPVLIVLSGICLVFSLAREVWWRGLALIAGLGLAAYAIASPSLPPSLIASIRENARVRGETGWDVSALTTISLAILAWVLVSRLLRRWNANWQVRFVVFFALLTTSIPAMWTFLGRTVVPQAFRYHMEMDLAWALLLVVVASSLWKRMPASVARAVTLALLSLGAEQISQHRHYAKEVFAPVDITATLDYKAARFIDANLPPGGRVFLAGSTAEWFNHFSSRAQFAGSSFSTAFSQVHQMAFRFLYIGDGPANPQAEKGLLWLKAFGVQAIAVPGKMSPEMWHPFADPDKFDGLLEPIWKENDTTIYSIPIRSLSLAHVVKEDDVVRHNPERGNDTAEIKRFVDGLERAELPLATWLWKGHDQAEADADVSPGQVIAIQVSYHPGWHARVNGVEVAIHRDGLGLMWLKTPGPGQNHVELRYDGGWEMRVCRIISLLTCILLALYAIFGLPKAAKEYGVRHLNSLKSIRFGI